MKVLNSSETKARLAEILDVFDAYCEKHGIVYWIDYGTLLGAVRHQGFIPWDDDIDVVLPRPEYEKLNECAKTDPFPEPFEWRSFENGKLDYPFGKLTDLSTQTKSLLNTEDNHLWMDVFPMDGVPEGIERKKLLDEEKKLIAWSNRSIAKTGTGNTALRKVLRIPLLMYAKMRGLRYYGDKLRKAALAYPYGQYEKAANTVWGDAYEGEVLSKDDLYPLTRVPFEGKTYPAIREYKKRLVNLYGDYMKLPEEKERRYHSKEISETNNA